MIFVGISVHDYRQDIILIQDIVLEIFEIHNI